MLEEKTGEDNAAAAESQEAGANLESDGQAEDTSAAEGNQNAGLEAALVAEREKRQEAETVAQTAQDQLALMTQHNAQQPTTVEQKTMFRAVAERLGIDPELAEPEEIGRIVETMLQVSTVQNQQSNFINSRTDYAQVVGATLSNGQFQAAPPLMRVLKDNPELAKGLMQNPNPEIAYALASKDPQYVKEKAEKDKPADIKASEKAEEVIRKAAEKLSVSAAGSAGSVDKVAAVAAMTDAELDEHIEKAKSEA